MRELSQSLAFDHRLEEAVLIARSCISLNRSTGLDFKGLKNSSSGDGDVVFNNGLASALDNLSIHLLSFGCLEEALAAGLESVALYRAEATRLPAVFNPSLARSLGNLSSGYAGLGRYEEALDTADESVALYRDLAQKEPSTFNCCLAICLNNLSLHHSYLGHREKAVEISQECLALYRELLSVQTLQSRSAILPSTSQNWAIVKRRWNLGVNLWVFIKIWRASTQLLSNLIWQDRSSTSPFIYRL